MIKQNQALLNRLNVISDGLIIFVMLPVAFYLRFYILPGGQISVPLQNYLLLGGVFTLIQLLTYAFFGLYRSFRKARLMYELSRLWLASLLDMALLLGWLFLEREMHYSRLTFALFFLLSVGTLSVKRVILRTFLRRAREKGYNQKHVLILGNGSSALRYLREIENDRSLGYNPVGYISDSAGALPGLERLGGFEDLDSVLERYVPDEVVSAIEMEDYARTPQIISDCDKNGCKLSIIPFYAEYMPSAPQFDELNGIPLLNVRHIPLDNWGNAFCKRAGDIVLSALLLILLSPLMLFCAIGVRLSSPGPVFFRQQRVGRNKKLFYMYKFRSMRLNAEQDTAWSSTEDSRRTAFGAFLRKCSLDELPQLWNVLKGDMSLVGPRPELPYFVEQFREEVPLYMVKHQVRPGITGWAQINGLRGDTSIAERINYDVYYIEHWTLWLDIKILWITVFRGKFLNDESLTKAGEERRK